MSVLIKGMQMPTSCYYCGLTDTSFINCQAFSPCRLLEDDCEERRPDWCPLVEIPEKHGDLIDRQKLLEDNKHLEYPTNEKYRSDRAWAVGFNAVARHCNEHAVYADTIIEAEGA